MTIIEKMPLGSTGLNISRLGLGCWAIGGHGWGKVNDKDSFNAVKCAFDNGINFYDTADVYGLGKSEMILSKALESSWKEVIIASKGGVRWNESGKVWTDISPVYMRKALEGSLKRLNRDHIHLYYIHKPDGKTPIQESIAALERMREEGKIGAIGLSNFSAEELLEALKIAPIAAIQVRLNIFDRDYAMKLIEVCKKYNITLIAWGALADGLLTGKFTSNTKFSEDDHRFRMPSFNGETFSKHINCVKLFEEVANRKQHKISQLALRWLLDLEPFICSLFGAKTDAQVKENIGSFGWKLNRSDLLTIDSIIGRIFPKF